MHMLLNCPVTGEEAARRLLSAAAQECDSAKSCSTALYHLITSALDQPIAGKVLETLHTQPYIYLVCQRGKGNGPGPQSY